MQTAPVSRNLQVPRAKQEEPADTELNRISATYSDRLASAEGNTTLGQIVWSDLNGYLVTSQNTNVVLAHLARDVSHNNVAILKLYFKGSVWQGFKNGALHLDTFFFCHK